MAELKEVYDRELNPADPKAQDSLAKIARLIAPNSLVLDVGCGKGILGEYLARERGCTVDGIEISAEAARVAARSHRRVVVGDLDQFDFESALNEKSYDYIVCADVLEHVKEPAPLATRLKRLLGRNGRMLLSIPHVGYAGLIAGLLNGEFRYRREGLLDQTHLRFFTRRSVLDLLREVGLHALDIDVVHLDLSDSEFAREGLEGFAPSLREQLLSSPDALTYQFVVQAVPVDSDQPATRIEAPPPAAATFLAKLYWRSGDDPGFDELRAAFLRPKLGVEPQRLRFPLPPLAGDEVGLRLDVADRPAFVRLYDVAAYDTDGTCVWRWDPEREPLATLRTNELLPVDDDQRGHLLVSRGDDPYIAFSFPAGDALARGGYVEVDLTWPASSDSLAVSSQLAHSNAGRLLARFDQEKSKLHDDLEQSRREQRRLFLEWTRFERRNALLERENSKLRVDLDGARQEVTELRRVLDEVNNSITFRAAKPVYAVMKSLRGLRKPKP
jgi:2-polyprenyl-3-methyl-5-hydroxy-6-metoxy-1,4-benzoquinol methylase